MFVGGRLRTEPVDVNADDDNFSERYELGGAVIHKSNRYMVNFCEELGLKRIFNTEHDTLLLVGGENNSSVLLRTTCRWPTILTLFHRYGFDLVRLYFILRRQLSLFCAIYSKQEREFLCCDNVIVLLELFTPQANKNNSFSFQQQCCRTLRDHLTTYNGFSRRFVDEIAQAAVRVNYGQTVDELHALVGLISLAGAQNNSLWHVENGNASVVHGLLVKFATKVFVDHTVETVKFSLSTGVSQLTVRQRNSIFSAEYDCVVIACPLTKAGIKFVNADNPDLPLFKHFSPFLYQRIVTTLVKKPGAEPVDAKFNGLPISKVDEAIFLTAPVADDDLPFNSVAIVKPASSKPVTWWQKCLLLLRGSSGKIHHRVRKVFSLMPFDAGEYFSSVHDVPDIVSIDWLAYPQYGPIRRWFASYFCSERSSKLPDEADTRKLPVVDVAMKFSMAPERGLYYINAIETLGSAMEMSAIGAKNVALLIKRDYNL